MARAPSNGMAANSADSAFKRAAAAKLTQLQSQGKTDLSKLDLFEFMVQASPHLRKPEHLEAALAYMEAIDETPQSFALSAPPRHGKSVMVNHLVARQMMRHPGIRIAYGCYNLDLAGFNSDEVKDILQRNNVELNKHKNAKEEWKLANGSVFKCVAPGSGFTGRGADLIVIDDPYKGRAEAESGRIRDATWNWFTAVAITRKSPKASVILTHTRWHIDDLTGRVSSQFKWPYVNLPAISADSEALWPDEWPLHRLRELEAMLGAYEWNSLYQGRPRPRGGAVFSDKFRFYGGEVLSDDGESLITNPIQLPTSFRKIVIGIDAAYTEKTYSDYSVAVVMGIGHDGLCYILDVVRMQVEAPKFGVALKELRMRYHSPPIYWFVGGVEVAVGDFFMNSLGVPVKMVPARDDKFVRAQAVAAAWNAGKVLLPAGKLPWKDTFLDELLVFSGLDDPHDDQVDALAAAYIPLAGKRVTRGNMTERLLAF